MPPWKGSLCSLGVKSNCNQIWYTFRADDFHLKCSTTWINGKCWQASSIVQPAIIYSRTLESVSFWRLSIWNSWKHCDLLYIISKESERQRQKSMTNKFNIGIVEPEHENRQLHLKHCMLLFTASIETAPFQRRRSSIEFHSGHAIISWKYHFNFIIMASTCWHELYFPRFQCINRAKYGSMWYC